MNIETIPDKKTTDIFAQYLTELFYDLLLRVQGCHNLLQPHAFSLFLNTPMIISQKLFRAFNNHNKEEMTLDSFVNGFINLYTGHKEKRLILIFSFFDFNVDGYVEMADVLLIFSHFHLLLTSSPSAELDELINNFFDRQIRMSNEAFLRKVIFENSDIVFLFMIFLRHFKLLHASCLIYFNSQIKNESQDNEHFQMIPNLSNPKDISDLLDLAKPSELLKVYLNKYLDLDLNCNEEDEDLKLLDVFEEDIGSAEQLIEVAFTIEKQSTLQSKMVNAKKRNSEFCTRLENANFFVSRSEKSRFSLPEKNNGTNITECLIHQIQIPNESVGVGVLSHEKSAENVEIIVNEWYCFCIHNERFTKCKVAVVEDNLFCFVISKSKKTKINKIYHLHNSFTEKCAQRTIQRRLVYPVALSTNTPNKEAYFFFENQGEMENFLEVIRKRTHETLSITDKYEIQEEIGEGRFGKVFKGVNVITRETVAIKTVKKNSREMSMVQNEKDVFNFLSRTSHPHIIKAIELFETSDSIYFIYEYIRDGSLGKHLMNKKELFSLRQVKDILCQIGSAVKYLHSYGIVHRDIKPDNILITNTANALSIKLIDYGFAKTMGLFDRTTEPYGTIGFAAPEIITRKDYNRTVDVWSFGVLAYYMYYARLPFDEDENNNKGMEYTFPVSHSQEDDRLLKKIIQKCLVKDSCHRSQIDQIMTNEFFAK